MNTYSLLSLGGGAAPQWNSWWAWSAGVSGGAQGVTEGHPRGLPPVPTHLSHHQSHPWMSQTPAMRRKSLERAFDRVNSQYKRLEIEFCNISKTGKPFSETERERVREVVCVCICCAQVHILYVQMNVHV